VALGAELVVPRPEAACQPVQAVLMGEAGGAVHLMDDLGHLGGGFTGSIVLDENCSVETPGAFGMRSRGKVKR